MNRKELSNIVKISSLYIAATIGAGFASGKEIFLYFTQYNVDSHLNIILAGFLFWGVGFLFLDFIKTRKPEDFNDFFKILLNRNHALLCAFFVAVFMLGVFSIMISGIANIIANITSITYFYAILLTIVPCYIILVRGIKGIVFVSAFITPILIICIFALCILFLQDSNAIPVFSQDNLHFHWSLSSIMYIAYNIIISTAVMIDIQYLMTSRKVIFFSTLLGSLGLFFTSFLINKVLTKYYLHIIHEPIPMLSLAKYFNHWIFYIWSLVLLLAMLSTALSSAIGCLDYIDSKVKLNINIRTLFFLLFAIPLSQIGFTQLILLFYPIFGFMGLFLIILVLIKTMKNI